MVSQKLLSRAAAAPGVFADNHPVRGCGQRPQEGLAACVTVTGPPPQGVQGLSLGSVSPRAELGQH